MFRLLPRTRSSAIADRLHVNEYFAKSLKVIRNHTVEKGVCITAYCNSVYTSYEAPLGNDCKQLQVLMRTGRTKNGPIPALKSAGPRGHSSTSSGWTCELPARFTNTTN